NTMSVGVLLGNGDGTLKPVTTSSIGSNLIDTVAVGDLNSDGIPDLFVGFYYSVGIMFGKGDGTFGPLTTLSSAPGAFVHRVAVADLDLDGRMDLVIASEAGAVMMLGNGNGTFKTSATIGAGSFTSILVSDLNGDGRPDVAGTLSTQARAFLANGG